MNPGCYVYEIPCISTKYMRDLQKKKMKPTATLASAHHGVASGDPMYAICAQSKVIKDIPYEPFSLVRQTDAMKVIHQSTAVAEQLVDDNVVWRNPADPVEERERLEDVAGEEVPASRARKCDEEELFAPHTAAATHARVDLLVEGVEERARNQVCRPDCARGDVSDQICDMKRALELTHGRRLHEETPSDATNREANLDQTVSCQSLGSL